MIGVFRSLSCFLRKPGDPTSGLRSSDGKVPDAGVWRVEAAVLARLSVLVAAAMVAVAAVEAILTCVNE